MDSGEAQFAEVNAAAGVWTYALETSQTSRVGATVIANGQRVSEALTKTWADGSTNRTIVVALSGANDDPDSTDDRGASFTPGVSWPVTASRIAFAKAKDHPTVAAKAMARLEAGSDGVIMPALGAGAHLCRVS